MTDAGLQPPFNSLPPVPPPPVVPENPETNVRPPGKTARLVKKHGLKFAAGTALMAVIVSGALIGSALVKQRQSAEQLAAGDCPTGYKCDLQCQNDALQTQSACRDNRCYDGYDCKWNNNTKACYKSDSRCGPDDDPADLCRTCRLNSNEYTYNTYYCEGEDEDICKACSGNDQLPGGVRYVYNSSNETGHIQGGFCGRIQIDRVDNDENHSPPDNSCVFTDDSCDQPPAPSPSPSPSPSPEPSPQASLVCRDLTSVPNTNDIKFNDQVTYTCLAANNVANISVAFFRHRVSGGDWTVSPARPINNTSKKATYAIKADSYGNWHVQCRICTDASASKCSVWGGPEVTPL